VPSIALLAEDASSTFPVVTIVGKIAPVLVPPIGVGCGSV
jgi:hypothetical protein